MSNLANMHFSLELPPWFRDGVREAVAAALDGLNVAGRVGIGIDLGAQVLDVDVDQRERWKGENQESGHKNATERTGDDRISKGPS